jgi:hypothetical protein
LLRFARKDEFIAQIIPRASTIAAEFSRRHNGLSGRRMGKVVALFERTTLPAEAMAWAETMIKRRNYI